MRSEKHPNLVKKEMKNTVSIENLAGSSDKNYYEANRASLLPFLPDSYERVLEVGCASGGFSKNLLKAKEIWGVEPFAPAAQIASSVMTRVLVGRYEDVDSELPDHYFDLIVCNDVIEHMVDPYAFLDLIKKKAKPGAWLVGSLPNVLHITALIKLLVLKDWRYSESGILDKTHLRFFTKKSIRRMFLEGGYRIDKFEGLGSVIRYGLVRPEGEHRVLMEWIFRVFSAIVVIFSLGFYSETQFPQYGFRVQLPK